MMSIVHEPKEQAISLLINILYKVIIYIYIKINPDIVKSFILLCLYYHI